MSRNKYVEPPKSAYCEKCGTVKEGHDFRKMKLATDSIVKIQALFRRALTMNKLDKEIERQRAELNKKKVVGLGITPEESALREFK